MTALSFAASPADRVRTSLVTRGAWIRGLRGWRRVLLAFVAGAVSALAFAPFDVFPALLLATAVLLLLVDGAVERTLPGTADVPRAFAGGTPAVPGRVLSAALGGWAFGFGQFLAGLYWVGYAFTVDASAHAWQIPFVAMLLPGYLAFFPALACAVTARFWRPGSGRIFLFAAAYAICEWLRGTLLTGFPWNLAAYGWGALPGIMQSTAVIGAYGLTLLTILLGASLAEFASASPRARLLPLVLTALFALLWAGGEMRLAFVHPGDVPGVRLRLVQPDIPQAEKYLPQFVSRNWDRLIDPSEAPARQKPTLIIWPEAAPPFLITRSPEALARIAALTPGNRVLMTGSPRIVATPDDGFHYFNSLFIFSRGGQLTGIYDKFHLVPFGEYLPLPGLLHALGLSKLVDMPDGFREGPGPRTLRIPGAPPAGVLICYEIIFPGAVIGAERPGWIVNVTDDSWFGPSTGPSQHLLMTRIRAIEEGLPVARDANTGISAVIDPLGRVTASLSLGRRGFLDSGLPRALPTTPFARLGNWSFALLLILCLLCTAANGQRAKKREAED